MKFCCIGAGIGTVEIFDPLFDILFHKNSPSPSEKSSPRRDSSREALRLPSAFK